MKTLQRQSADGKLPTQRTLFWQGTEIRWHHDHPQPPCLYGGRNHAAEVPIPLNSGREPILDPACLHGGRVHESRLQHGSGALVCDWPVAERGILGASPRLARYRGANARKRSFGNRAQVDDSSGTGADDLRASGTGTYTMESAGVRADVAADFLRQCGNAAAGSG